MKISTTTAAATPVLAGDMDKSYSNSAKMGEMQADDEGSDPAMAYASIGSDWNDIGEIEGGGFMF